MTTPPALQPLEEWPAIVRDRRGRGLMPGDVVRVLGHEGGRSHDGHVVGCARVEADGDHLLSIWQDGRELAPHFARWIERQDDANGRPLRYRGEENDEMAKKKTSTKKAGGRLRKTKADEAANEAPTPIRKHGRQGSIPGTTDPDIKEIDDICAEFKDHDDSMHAHKAEANRLRGAIATAMEKHNRQLYEYANKRFVYEPGAPKLKVQTIKDDDE